MGGYVAPYRASGPECDPETAPVTSSPVWPLTSPGAPTTTNYPHATDHDGQLTFHVKHGHFCYLTPVPYPMAPQINGRLALVRSVANRRGLTPIPNPITCTNSLVSAR